MKERYRHIVIGAGAIGTAAAYWLSKVSDGDVLVLEQFEIGHTLGSSEDHSRIIRHSYSSTAYTNLTRAAYKAWAHVEEQTGLDLVHKTGHLDLATEDTAGAAVLSGVKDALASSGIMYEEVDAAEIRKRWPQWNIDDSVYGIYQREGGILDIRHANAAHIALARTLGATFLANTPVTRVIPNRDGVTVRTSKGTFSADSLTLCAGSWNPELLAPLGVNLPVTLSQEQVSYFATPNLRDFTRDRFPTWIYRDNDTDWYGFPIYGEPAVKVARDMAGRFITQQTRSYEPDPEETEILRNFLAEKLPSAVGTERVSKTCVYDMPPDRDFILDHVPGFPNISLCVGAGHAGKFAGLFGSILADLATSGSTIHPISAFRADRPALTDPNFIPAFHRTGTAAATR